MKFFHLSDLHFGKQLHGYDLIEEQRAVINGIVQAAEKEKPDAILIAGDIYDKAMPSGSAMTLLEELFLGLNALSAERPVEIIVVAGNHDSAPRLRYGSAFLKRHHIHIAVFPPQEEGEFLQRVTLADEQGEIEVYLLPYVSAGMLRHLAGGEMLHSTEEAVRFLLNREKIDWNRRNILVSHQFYLYGGKEPEQCDSETPRLYVGGLDSVPTTVVEKFDYVALGHIHSPQDLGSERIRYCGTPYPYSVSEVGQEKSITVVELGKKGSLSRSFLPLQPLRQVRSVRGRLEEVAGQVGDKVCHDYVSITLTDEEPLNAPRDYLEHYYDYILEIRLDNARSRKILEEETEDFKELTPQEAFAAFFEDMTGREMTREEETLLQSILQELS